MGPICTFDLGMFLTEIKTANTRIKMVPLSFLFHRLILCSDTKIRFYVVDGSAMSPENLVDSTVQSTQKLLLDSTLTILE